MIQLVLNGGEGKLTFKFLVEAKYTHTHTGGSKEVKHIGCILQDEPLKAKMSKFGVKLESRTVRHRIRKVSSASGDVWTSCNFLLCSGLSKPAERKDPRGH